MTTRNSFRRLLATAGALAVMLLTVSGAAMAVNTGEILQAVKNDVPNTGNARVVMAELFSRDN